MIAVLDFGSQYTQLIARRLRELGYLAKIFPYNVSMSSLSEACGVILSGGPASVYASNSPQGDVSLLSGKIPVLGICYGMQWMVHALGGRVARGEVREYGRARVRFSASSLLSACESSVWMSHGDRVESLPEGFSCVGESDSSPFAMIAEESLGLYAVQFHPEVSHSECGIALLSHFAERCGLRPAHTSDSMTSSAIAYVRARAPEGRILCGLSGGVDSAVVAALCHRAVGDRVFCIFVDNGLLRTGEVEDVMSSMSALGVSVRCVDARARFLSALCGVTDPEEKRKTIGRVFVEVFEEEASREEDVRYLAQGTLYPDVIESVSAHGGPTAKIKSHHNVGGLPERMKLSLVEPLREFFKDEVRRIGLVLGLPAAVVNRQPFPGPGLGIRIVGEISEEKLRVVHAGDVILREELLRAGWDSRVWQAFCVYLPVHSVGVKGDERSYDATLVLRVVESLDGMTADWSRVPYDCLSAVSTRILNEVSGVGRVVFDVSQKPPATIEWE